MRRLTPDYLQADARPLLVGADGGLSPVAARASQAEAEQAHRSALEAAFDEAREQGLAAARREAETQMSARLQATEKHLRETHESALAQLAEERAELARLRVSLEAALERHAHDCEELAIEVAFAALVRVLGEASRERNLVPDVCRTILREYGHPSATLRVCDLDLPLLEGIDLGVPVEGDRRLAPGEAVIDTARGQFECGLDVRLAAIAQALATTLAAHRSVA
jgi:flagellar biosynthesis/type III secretory pathway protein FliH